MSQRQCPPQLSQTQLPTIWTVPEKMWQKIRPLLPSEKQPGTPGRPNVPFLKGPKRHPLRFAHWLSVEGSSRRL
jgi:hypothetical protein